ncbi:MULTISPECIES: dethiobiotin synthase [unclassified Limnobacter]|uniref:dethiobiotin synthase n=1 Tax=unclassified Limnobacter TaxID=2630203 RepID=UPI000156CC81|nr:MULTISPECIES: dethiobiotin synthase [unclassified Limnobacter]EDM83874.1 Dethiobiotin synthetase [Limnobacter sp. MED105]MAZ10650.1 dethiobiotin synthase [Sutterellaceae bacterium]
MKHLFVTGTDTGIGKTIASAWLCKHWQADYWKPVQSGLDGGSDSEWIARLSGCTVHPETYRLTQPLSPHQAADIDGIKIQLSDFVLPKAERLIIEGAGGCMVPLNWRDTMLDLMKHLNSCALLVARSGLGTINHTCLSLQALKAAGVPVLGVVMVGETHPANREAIEHFGEVPVLAELPVFNELSPQALAEFCMPERLIRALGSL